MLATRYRSMSYPRQSGHAETSQENFPMHTKLCCRGFMFLACFVFLGFALIFVTKSKDTDEAGKRHFFR
jgi:hypothetical protein